MRFAYLFLVHRMTKTLETAIRLLDDERNDIYIHVDAKAKDFPFDEVGSLAKQGRVFFTKQRIDAAWGGFELVEAELVLLKEATAREQYGYYHLLSGDDLPLKSQDEMHAFFEANEGKEFVQFCREYYDCPGRTDWYHVFSHSFRSKNTIKTIPQKAINKSLQYLQGLVHFQRHPEIDFQKGAQWFSITDGFARYVVSQEPWIRKIFHHTFCSDEVFLQTLCVNSDFRQRLYHPDFDDAMEANMRYTGWDQDACSPRVFRLEDFDTLMNTGMMFARKFSADVDEAILEAIAQKVLGKGL